MTPEQIDAMPAGKELDALIAEHVLNARRIEPEQIEMIKMILFQFGRWNPGDNFAETLLIRRLSQKNPYTGCDFEFVQPYDYSSRIDSAYVIVGEMKLLGLRLWLCDFGDYHQAAFLDDNGKGEKSNAETPMLAIGRAALKTKFALNKRGEK